MVMLFSSCVLCAIRSPVSPVHLFRLMRSVERTTRVLCSVAHGRPKQIWLHPVSHIQKSGGFWYTNTRNFSSVTRESWKKCTVMYRPCVLSERSIVMDSQSFLKFRSVFELGYIRRLKFLVNSDTGFQYRFVSVGHLVRSQMRFYSMKEPKKHSAADSEKNSIGDHTSVKKTIIDLRHDKILTVPNVLTTLRMLMAPMLGYLVIEEAYSVACIVFVVAGLTDLLDGFIARNFQNQTSALGSFIDPLADKLLISVLFVSLTVVNLLPVALTALVVARDICLMSAGFYVRYISLTPRPKSLREYFDITNASAKLQPTLLSKVNTAVQLSVVAFTLAAPVFDYVEHPAIQALWYLTAATTVGSGVGYLFARNTFKLLQSRKNP